MSYEGRKQWRVTPHEAGMRLLAFLREKNRDAPSIKSLKRAIDGKCCTVNGQTKTFSSHCLKSNDLVTLNSLQAPPLHLSVLYEDDALLIVDKPAGLICENRYFAPLLHTKAELIHRLDKETTGILLLAKNREIQEAMLSLFRQRAIRKHYLALVDGCVSESQGIIKNSLKKKSSVMQGQVFYEVCAHKKFNEAITHWKCVKKARGASLLLCELVTGRTHQLRVHLEWLGHPILGDTHYGKHFRCRLNPQRQLLHAHSICFSHPKTGKPLEILSPPPADFVAAQEKLFQ
jgi:23S rRNA pseudouridine955/2504/2580 synthase